MIPKPHSKIGIFSCITAVAVWIYLAAAFYLIFYVDGFTKILTDIFVPESRGVSDLRGMGIAVVLFAVIFFIIPAVGHIIGALAGTIGLFRSGTRRLFSIVGVILNVLPTAILFVFWMIGSFVPSN